MTQAETKKASPGRPYHKPELQTLGLVRELTRAGGSANNEGANVPECLVEFDKANDQCNGPG